jgi:hypothetical protein
MLHRSNLRMTSEWLEWHRGYEGESPLAHRLRVVQERIREALDRRPRGPIRLISLCAGDGRDLLGVLVGHPRASDVNGRLVEITPELAAAAKDRATRNGLHGIQVVVGDASDTRAYAGAVPADLILVCGVFGNLSDLDVRGTIEHLPELCAPEATVIWTRGRFAPDLTPSIRAWFVQAGFTELSFVPVPGSTASVGAHQLTSSPRPFQPDAKLFTFLPKAERPSTRGAARGDGPEERTLP